MFSPWGPPGKSSAPRFISVDEARRTQTQRPPGDYIVIGTVTYSLKTELKRKSARKAMWTAGIKSAAIMRSDGKAWADTGTELFAV